MNEIEKYVRERQERINKIRKIELVDPEALNEADSILSSAFEGLASKSNMPIRKIDRDNSLENYLNEQFSNIKLQYRIRARHRLEELSGIKRQTMRNISKENMDSLIDISGKTSIIYNTLSKGEIAILEFIHSFDNYRLAAQYGEIEGEDRLEEAKIRYNSLKAIGTEKVKKALLRLIQENILNQSDKKSLYDMLKEIREISRDQREIDNRANINVALEILGIEDRKVKEKIIDNCNYKDLEDRICSLEAVISSEASYSILRENPNLLLESKECFYKFIDNIAKISQKSSKIDLEQNIKASPNLYCTIDAAELLSDEETRKKSDNLYNKEMATAIIEILKRKGHIGENYTRIEHLRRDVNGKIENKVEMDNFYKNLKALIDAGALIAHRKKSKTDFPVSLNPHYSEVNDLHLKEALKNSIGINGRS